MGSGSLGRLTKKLSERGGKPADKLLEGNAWEQITRDFIRRVGEP